ncbi:MAG: NAD-dependent epimerase/dehydratase family protein [Thermoplasmata archaeon]
MLEALSKVINISDKVHNADKTCWNCPGARFKGNVDFRGCGQSRKVVPKGGDKQVVIECRRRSALGRYEPTITFQQCPEWQKTEYGYLLKNMRVMIFDLGGYIGWPLALRLAGLGCDVFGVDEPRDKDETLIPTLPRRIESAKDLLGLDIKFQYIEPGDRETLKDFMTEVEPEVVVHYRKVTPDPSAGPNSSVGVQLSRVTDTTGLLKMMKEVVPTSTLIKLCTVDEYENLSLSQDGDHLRSPDNSADRSREETYDVQEACKSWWLRSYDIMQDVIFGIHTTETSSHPDLTTRLDHDLGSIVNRFVIKAVSETPLTIYGKGNQIRSIIPLEDAVECMVRFISSPLEPGQYKVINHLSGFYKVKEVAQMIADTGKRYGLDVNIRHIENPHEEAKRHLFEVISKSLSREHDFTARVSLEEEIDRMFEILTKEPMVKHVRGRTEEGDTVVIVSGLPRSGTSMMMKMLEKGGLEILTDKVQAPDLDNPKGYYEYEKVKSLPEDDKWIEEARGKVVKILGELIKHLPRGYNYKIIFMERDIDEIMESQEKMLKHRGKDSSDVSKEEFKQIFRDYVKILKNHINSHQDMEVIYVSYNDIMSLPRSVIESISVFLDGSLDVDEMLTVVDEELYRNRAL